jgi:3-oxoadipate enol-lactonase
MSLRHAFGLARVQRPAVNVHIGGSGTPVVLVNGWTASGLVWPSAWIRDLESRRTVVRIDNRGTGWSRSAPAPYEIGDLADDVAVVIQAERLRDAIVLGLSMGGMIAQEVALRHPQLVRHLVLVGTRPPGPAHLSMKSSELTSVMRRRQPGEPLRDFIRSLWEPQFEPSFRASHPEAIDEIVDHVLERPTPRRSVVTQARAIAGWYGADRLRSLTVPTTVIHGTEDALMPVGNGVRLAQLIPSARYVEVPGVGHLVPFEAPEVISAELERLAALENLLP